MKFYLCQASLLINKKQLPGSCFLFIKLEVEMYSSVLMIQKVLLRHKLK